MIAGGTSRKLLGAAVGHQPGMSETNVDRHAGLGHPAKTPNLKII